MLLDGVRPLRRRGAVVLHGGRTAVRDGRRLLVPQPAPAGAARPGRPRRRTRPGTGSSSRSARTRCSPARSPTLRRRGHGRHAAPRRGRPRAGSYVAGRGVRRAAYRVDWQHRHRAGSPPRRPAHVRLPARSGTGCRARHRRSATPGRRPGRRRTHPLLGAAVELAGDRRQCCSPAGSRRTRSRGWPTTRVSGRGAGARHRAWSSWPSGPATRSAAAVVDELACRRR